MTAVQRKAWVIGFAVAGACVGFLTGYSREIRSMRESSTFMSESAALGQYGQLAFWEYQNADAEHAKAALNDEVTFIDRMLANGMNSTQSAMLFDRALTYVRLSQIEKSTGHAAAAEEDLAKAKETLESLDGKKFSDQHMKEFAAKALLLDGKNSQWSGAVP